MEQTSSGIRPSVGWVIALALIGAVATAALVVAVLAYLRPAPTLDSAATPEDGTPRIVSEDELRTFGTQNDLVYWAGPRDDVQYELTYTASGDVYVRYLAEDAEVGDAQADYLTVATYPVQDAFAQLQTRGEEDGYTTVTTENGAIIVTDDSDPARAYFAFPDTQIQVEVFSPDDGAALELVSDGSLVLLR